jgi:mRNA-degrading endonuclease RelE of RelBE toxin-antitoxin system
VRSRTTEQFRRALRELPEDVQALARTAYRRFQENPAHPGLHFRRVNAEEPVYSARIGLHYRAVALVEGGEAVWFWIGSHAEYDHLMAQL